MRRHIVFAITAGLALTGQAVMAQSAPYADAIYDACGRYGCDGGRLVRVMECESGGDPGAVNPVTGDTGLFQFNPNTWTNYGGGDIWNPYDQIELAAQMWAEGEGRQWVCQG